MVGSLLLKMLLWAALGFVLGLSASYFNLWRGPGWRISLLAAAAGLVAGAYLDAIPNAPSVGGLSIVALLGAVGAAFVAIVIAIRFSKRGRPLS